MCGIAGILEHATGGASGNVSGAIALMVAAIAHRGPDAQGIWQDRTEGIHLGHRRLSILDLSEAGAQPMSSPCGRFVVVFNGEIYNHLEIRRALEADGAVADWRGHSDTETLCTAISRWGLFSTLRRAFGMFAIAVWDRRLRILQIARDRMGEKPVYVAHTEEAWAFGSELKALYKAPGFRPRVDERAIEAFLTYGYVPEGHCIFKDVFKVSPGSLLTLAADAGPSREQVYERFHELAFNNEREELRGRAAWEPDSLSRQMEELLGSVVEEQMLSDVPLGCFLSGGIDSSLVASLMQVRRDTQVRTFSVGFAEHHFNEAPHAARVARHLGTDHTEFILSEEDALAVIHELPEVYDEPFADSSQIPILVLCRHARRSVTVALTGDGGDEVFGGYNRHVLGPELWRMASRIPIWLRSPVGSALKMLDRLAAMEGTALRRWSQKFGLPVTAIDKSARIAAALSKARKLEDLYEQFVQMLTREERALIQLALPVAERELPVLEGVPPLDDAEWMMAMDSQTYLPGDILVKLDRAAMSSSLETRAPFLDARVVRAAWQLPPGARISDRRGKVILRDILDRHLPHELTSRQKQGFAVPLDRWLRGALRSWADQLFARDDLARFAGLDSDRIGDLWQDHLARKANHGHKLWTILSLFAWLNHNADALSINEHGEAGPDFDVVS